MTVPYCVLGVTVFGMLVKADPTLVTVEQGQLQGGTRFGTRFFDRIPFAQAPVGNLRFAPPQLPLPWSGVRDARYLGKRCYQIGASNDDSSEDCLQLNIFTPMDIDQPLPVAVWVHGGGYQQGSGIDANGTGMVVASQNRMIVVTINYRLNVFGFLGNEAMRQRDPNHHTTGNYGLQDQRAALAWIHRNIAQFGGDIQRVGIFGESAGAHSVTCHLSAPASWPYFNASIAESGGFSLLSAQSLAYSEQVYNQTLALTKCQNLNCLLAMPALELVEAVSSLSLKVPFTSTYLTWSPTVDGVEMSKNPLLLAREGAIHPAAKVIQGFNQDEGSTFSYPLQQDMTQADWRSFVAKQYGDDMVTPLEAVYSNQTYPQSDQGRDADNISKWYWMAERTITDKQFACPTIISTRYLTNGTAKLAGDTTVEAIHSFINRSIYQYYFTDATAHSPFVGHGDEVRFVFNQSWTFSSAHEQQLANQFNDWWRTLISGQPPHSDRCPSNTDWPEGGNGDTFQIRRGCDQAEVSGLKMRECAVWEPYLLNKLKS
eukprot:TRINITY_DN11917_c2_g2_i1.p1 TRINITY_DN11917_c2_g2~~TRINITY_DN11917_c2_g2_i1.p1  ORF type:complete len:542 (+),score=62.20 TRINITY_DN11917_c2_g2_i1:3-1628(+)